MANVLYDKARERFLIGAMSWIGDNIKVMIIDSDEYTLDAATDEYLSDIPEAARIASSENMTGKTSTAGVADADDILVDDVTGEDLEALVIYKDTGDLSTSPLIAYMDDATGLPITSAVSASIGITWDDGPNKIFKL